MIYHQRTRGLDPEFVKLVQPLLPPPPHVPEDDDVPIQVEEVRAGMARMKEGKDRALNGIWKHLLTSVEVQNVQVAMRDGFEVEMRILRPTSMDSSRYSLPVYYSMHGGGFIAGNNDTEDLFNRQIAFESNSIVFSIDHRLVPEHELLSTVYNDAEDGLFWAFKNASRYGGDVEKGIVVGGTSSGALLAAVLAYRSSNNSLNVPITGCLIRQGAIMTPGSAKDEWQPRLKSMEENADAPIFNASSARRMSRLWNVPENKLQDPHNFPVFATKDQLSKFPRTFLVAAGLDPIVDEVYLFKDILDDAKIENKLTVYEGLPHGFHAFHELQGARKEMKNTAEGVSWLFEA